MEATGDLAASDRTGPSSPVAPVELQLRREVIALTVSRAAPVAVLMWLVFGGVAWLGWHAGASGPAAVLFVAATVSAAWRVAVVRARRRAPEPDAAMLGRLEFLVRANMLFAGLMWAFAAVTIFPRLDAAGALVFVVFQFVAVSLAALFASVIDRGFPLLAVPSTLTLLLVTATQRAGDAVLLGTLVAAYSLIMSLAARTFRQMTLLALRRGLEMQAKNAELARAIAAAEASAEAKTRFLATMSHELRTPMAGLLGGLELLQHARLSDSERHVLNLARMSGNGLLAVLNDVLDYATLEGGRVVIRNAPLSLRELLESVAGLFTLPAANKGLSLTLQVADDVPAWVLADAHRLRQVLLNLVGNALKFTDSGRIELRLRRTPAGLRFEVQDTGAGIAHDDLGRLFQPFQQLGAGTGRSHGGTGLGLAISQRLVQAMGGAIEVDSAPDRGACFAFTLALQDAAAPATAAAAAPIRAQPAPRVQYPGRVLLVDDNEVNRVVGSQMLALHGVQVVEARDGIEALERLHAEPFDLVLMDCEMPRRNGYEATAEWRREEARRGAPRLPIVAVSAHVMPQHLQAALGSGMDELLGKPFGLDQLGRVLARWLGASSRSRDAAAPDPSNRSGGGAAATGAG